MESNHSLRSLPSQPKVAVIGLGYVGLPLAVAFSRHVPVLGFDINAARVAELNGGEDRTLEVTPAELQKALAGGGGAAVVFVDDPAPVTPAKRVSPTDPQARWTAAPGRHGQGRDAALSRA